MDDFSYLFRDSATAWLHDHDDGRFARYEQFYATERQRYAAKFDLESTNEAYAKWTAVRPSHLLSVLGSPVFARLIIALFAAWIAARTVPVAAAAMPAATGGALLVAFVSLRVFHWKRRRVGRRG